VRLEKMLIVEDAPQDGRFAEFSAVRADPGVRFYAGSPVADSSGIVVGTFCLLDFKPRSLDEHERQLLTELAGWARQELVGSADTQRAREVQQKLLPDYAPDFAGYDVAALCLAAQTVGGDFYDYRRVDDRFEFCVADVMGKGTGAAIITATLRAAMRAASRRASPAAVLTDTSRAIQRDLDATASLVTGFAAYIDGPSGTLNYVDAGHGLTVVVGDDGRVCWLESLDLPLGVDPTTVWTERQVVLRRGDTLLCFSDGLLELYGGGRDALDDIAGLVGKYPEPGELTERIRELTGESTLSDDVTGVAVRRR
jgi:serine phosphatase RsbU (regulator of sigma subunit)